MTLRDEVFKRDKGICAKCGVDTELLIQAAMHEDGCTRQQAIKALGEYWGFGWSVKSLWQADHRIPRHRGGTDDLSNLDTLCLPCHRTKTSIKDVPDAARDRRKRAKHERHHAAMKARKTG